MTVVNKAGAMALGSAQITPPGGIQSPELLTLLSGYKKTIASRYRIVTDSEIDTLIPAGSLLISPKIDGQLWFAIFEDGEVTLASPRGRAIVGEIPLTKEARKMATKSSVRTVLAGELFALKKEGRARVGDIASLIAGGEGAETARIGFMAFDLIEGGDTECNTPSESYAERLEVLQRLLEGGKRFRAVKTEKGSSGADVRNHYDAWVVGDKAEGVIVRSSDGRIYKVKPSISIDAVALGYTVKTDAGDQARSLLLGLMREDGLVQEVGAVGNLGTDDDRRSLFKKLSNLTCESNFRRASSSGAVYKFVKPEVVVEVRVSDVQAQDASGDDIRRMVLTYESGWSANGKHSGASLIHPVFERVRDDKGFNETDLRIAQLGERVDVNSLQGTVNDVDLPKSEIIRREVYTKVSKGNTMVKKIVMWKTNKETLDSRFPAYVVHWTDFSPGRAEPVKRKVRPDSTLEGATAIADAIIAKEIKKGWELV